MQKSCKKGYKVLRLGKNNKFLVNMYGLYLEKNLGQFCLKVENKGDYNRIGTSPAFQSDYDLYIKPSLIMDKSKGYAYITYEGDYLDFEGAYKKAVEIQEYYMNTYEKYINIFCYKERCYYIDKKYLNKDLRLTFKSIEDDVLTRKYTYGAKHKAKKGLEKAQALTQKILAIRGE